MAAIWAEGFDDFKDWTSGTGNAEITELFQNRGGTITKFWESGGRFDGGYLELGQGGYVNIDVDPAASENYTTLIIGFAYKSTNAFYSAQTVFKLLNLQLNRHVEMFITTAGAIDIVDANSSVVATSTGVLTLNKWHWIEAKITIGASGSIEVRVDQGPSDSDVFVSATGEDFLHSSGDADIRFVQLSSPGGAATGFRYDDIHILDTQGGVNDDFLGDGRIHHLRPTSDVITDYTPSAGSDHYALVDETPWDDSDYIESATVTDVDQFGFGDLPTSPDAVDFVFMQARAKKDAGGTQMKLHIKSGSTTSTGSAKTLSTDYEYHKEIWDTDPDSAGSWTEALVNALAGGVEVA